MSLEAWKASNCPTWSDFCRRITELGLGQLYPARLEKLRLGIQSPTSWELKALMLLTNNEVDSYK